MEENDYTVLTWDDLEFELELAEAGIRKKIAFVENQVGVFMMIKLCLTIDGLSKPYECHTSEIGRV